MEWLLLVVVVAVPLSITAVTVVDTGLKPTWHRSILVAFLGGLVGALLGGVTFVIEGASPLEIIGVSLLVGMVCGFL